MLRFQIFAAGKKGNYHNIFTLVRPIRTDEVNLSWKKIGSGRGNVKLFEGYLEESKGKELLHVITASGNCSIEVYNNENVILFGSLLERPTVFVPNIPGSPVSLGWWPGTLADGFELKQWYRLGVDSESCREKNFQSSFDFIKTRTGLAIEYLQDFWGSVLYIEKESACNPVVKYNPDNCKVVFYLQGSVQPKERKVTVELWEGNECCQKHLFELLGEQRSIVFDAPFYPTQLGYELYEKDDQGCWRLKGKATHSLMRKIHINMGLVTGKLSVKKPAGEEEEYDIVVRDRDIKVDRGEDERQPWLDAERMRAKRNRGLELRELGSIFLRFSGPAGQQKIKRIIGEQIFKKTGRILWIWDPYLDKSILDDVLVLALRYPSTDVRLLLSECRGEKADVAAKLATDESDVSVVLKFMPRCKDIRDYLSTGEEAKVHLQKTGNLQVRNWFRSGGHTFHDRFVITETAVWHLGSSLKDIGNYHSTIYRLDGDLPADVRQEFQRAWDGEFKPMEPEGIEIFPRLCWLVNKKAGEKNE